MFADWRNNKAKTYYRFNSATLHIASVN